MGGGGVWIDSNSDREIFLWRLEWPQDIVADLVGWSNPAGRITKSDLELTALVLQGGNIPICLLFPLLACISDG